MDEKVGRTPCRLREFIPIPSKKRVGHELSRHSLVRLNRIRTGHGRFQQNMNQMMRAPSASWECSAERQTALHITSECSLHKCNGDLVRLDKPARAWLPDLYNAKRGGPPLESYARRRVLWKYDTKPETQSTTQLCPHLANGRNRMQIGGLKPIWKI